MDEVIVYDKAKYHYGGEFPQDVPEDQAFLHTGMFLGWILENGLYNSEFWEEAGIAGYITSFKMREITGAQIYAEACDGVLVSEELNDEGNSFAQSYFDFDKGQYIKDYVTLLEAHLSEGFHVQDSWENYEKIAQKISERYDEWKRKQAVLK